jgi:N6-L-threonylcarbamoyladenine synthase
MNILAIETSCDDTCLAFLEARDRRWPAFKVLSNIVSSQTEIHKKWGGVYPTLAKREHQKNLPLVLEKARRKAKNPKIDLIAVTIGPGLDPCLWTGVNFAKELAKKKKKQIVPINHIEAHIFANFLNNRLRPSNLLPAVCLIASGGHTQLILMKNFGQYKMLGETRDDAAGECFDKVARVLGLEYPGGPVIEAKAGEIEGQKLKYKITLPRPMIYQKNYDFSFSGLKTAVLYKVKEEDKRMKEKRYIQEMCLEVQKAIVDVLVYKTLKAVGNYQARTIIIGGGVTANNELRKQFKVKSKEIKVNFLVPKKEFSTDNAVMVGVAGFYQWLREGGKDWKEVEAKANLRLK